MPGNIPLEVQEDIIIRCPVKSLIRFRSVSKTWKSLIGSPRFIAAHYTLHAHSHRLLVEELDFHKTKKQYISILDDATFPQQKLNISHTVPLSIKLLKDIIVVGSCHGMFCFSGSYQERSDSHSLDYVRLTKQFAVVWNPSIRMSIDISLPSLSNGNETVIGFGVCPISNDSKILMAGKMPSCQVKIFTLNSRAWTSPTINPTRVLEYRSSSQVIIDRFIFWLVSDRTYINGGAFNLIVSFDLTTDEFGEVHLPHNLAFKSSLTLLKIRESLALIDQVYRVDKKCFDVWMLEDGVPQSFTKLFTIDALSPSLRILQVLGFRNKTDEAILVTALEDRFSMFSEVVVYEPFSQHMDYSVISGLFSSSFSVFSYTETLFLLNHPKFSVYFDMDEDGADD